MAHKSDIGGTVPGSGSGNAREIFQEGLHLPPVKFMSRLQPVKEIEAMITANSRTPALVIGDLRGQVGAARLGERRIAELMERYGKETVLESTELLSAYTENRVRQTIASWPDGESEGESFVDHDGIDLDRPIRVHVKVAKKGDRIHFDFSGCSDQTTGPANIRPPLVRAACAYCLVTSSRPASFRSIKDWRALLKRRFVKAVSLTRAFPRPSIPTCPQRSPWRRQFSEPWLPSLPEKRIAGGSGSAALVLGGDDTNNHRSYVHYEIFSGGTGARSGKDGVSATAFHLSNCKTAPIEIIESEFPTRVGDDLHRWAMVLHNQYPWDRTQTRLTPVRSWATRTTWWSSTRAAGRCSISSDGRRAGRSATERRRLRDLQPGWRPSLRSVPTHRCGCASSSIVLPKIEALAVVKGERLCTNDDLIRNTAYSWSPMSAQEITDKTGIESRVYSSRPLEDLALQAARAALEHVGPAAGGDRRGAVLHVHQRPADALDRHLAVRAARHAADPRLVRHRRCLRRPPLRPGRGDPAAAGGRPPGPAGLRGEVLRQDRHGPPPAHDLRRRCRSLGDRAGGAGRADRHRGAADLRERAGERGQLDHLAEPGVRQQHHRVRPGGALARRPLPQADDRRAAGPVRPRRQGVDPAGQHRPHRAAPGQQDDGHQAGRCRGRRCRPAVYFNIETVGNTSAASIPLAIADAKADGVIDEPLRVFAPGFGAGAVGGYAVLRIDPAIIARAATASAPAAAPAARDARTSPRPSENVHAAFG